MTIFYLFLIFIFLFYRLLSHSLTLFYLCTHIHTHSHSHTALILDADILLLDEPTNNLDTHGIEHLTDLIIATDKTVVVISHDEEFLNSFSDSVLYLDQHAKKVEQYDGKYVRSNIHTFI